MASAVTAAVKGGARKDLTMPPLVFPKTSKAEIKKGVKHWIVKNSAENIIEVSYQSSVDRLIGRISVLWMHEWVNSLFASTCENLPKSLPETAAQWVEREAAKYRQTKSTLCKPDATAQKLYKTIVSDMRVTLQKRHDAYVAKDKELHAMAEANNRILENGFYEKAKSVFEENKAARDVAVNILPLIEKHPDLETFLEALGVPLVNAHLEFIEVVREVEAENKADAAYIEVVKTDPMGTAEQGGPKKPVTATKGGALEMTAVSTNNANTK